MATNNKAVSTQIRNLYAKDNNYLAIRYYNTNLSFQIYPFGGKDTNGKTVYDSKASLTTTIGYDYAYVLYRTIDDIINSRIQEVTLTIPCMQGASIVFERKLSENNIYESSLTVNKNNRSIPFKFITVIQQIKENGVPMSRVIEAGLGTLMMTIAGYLVSIGADRHLDKLLDLYEKRQNENNSTNNQFKKNVNNNNQSFNNSSYNGPNPNNNYGKEEFQAFNPDIM